MEKTCNDFTGLFRLEEKVNAVFLAGEVLAGLKLLHVATVDWMNALCPDSSCPVESTNEADNINQDALNNIYTNVTNASKFMFEEAQARLVEVFNKADDRAK